MIEKNENEVGLFFDECAQKGYMEEFSEEELMKLEEALKRWDIQPGQRIMEPGCGAGRLTEYLARAVFPNGEVYACDLSAEMLRLVLKRNLPGNVLVAQASVNSVPKEDNYFDTIICFQVFPHFLNQARSLTEIARVLKRRGTLWIEHFKSREVINTHHKEASHVVAFHTIPDEKTMHRLLSQTGFEVQDINNSPQGYYTHAVKL